MISCAISRLVIVCFGTLYPAYASYKAVKTKNVKEYVKWMMYWIVFALFTCAETFTDVFLAFWFPFYYEIKIILVLWLLSPATKGSSFLYRKFVHPQLVKREKDIDEYLARAKEQGYHAVLQLGTKGINYASQVLVQTALKGGGHIVNHLHRSHSLTELRPNQDEHDFANNMIENRVSIEETVNHLTDDEQSFSCKAEPAEPTSSGYGSSEMIVDDVIDRQSPSVVPVASVTRLRSKRTKSTNLSEIGSSATLPRANKRTSGRRRVTAPVV